MTVEVIGPRIGHHVRYLLLAKGSGESCGNSGDSGKGDLPSLFVDQFSGNALLPILSDQVTRDLLLESFSVRQYTRHPYDLNIRSLRAGIPFCLAQRETALERDLVRIR